MRKPRSYFFHLSGAQLREIDELMGNFPSSAEIKRKARSLGLTYDQLHTVHARYIVERIRQSHSQLTSGVTAHRPPGSNHIEAKVIGGGGGGW